METVLQHSHFTKGYENGVRACVSHEMTIRKDIVDLLTKVQKATVHSQQKGKSVYKHDRIKRKLTLISD